MEDIRCPWCHTLNECDVWELSSGERYDWQCAYCEKFFSFDFEIYCEYLISDVRKEEF